MVQRRHKIWIAIATLACAAVAARAAAPVLVQRYVNGQLAAAGEYRGTVEDVDLALLRGGYVLKDVRFVKVAGDAETPFVTIPRMDLTLRWRALLRGRAVGDVVMHSPTVNFVQAKDESQKQFGAGVNWPEEIRDLFPFALDLVQIENGTATFRAPGIAADESLTAHALRVDLRNLTNVRNAGTGAFATIDAEATVMGDAAFVLRGEIDPNEPVPTFDVDFSLENAQLVAVNPWLEEFLNVDARAGAFSLYAELAAAEGRFTGYLRPILENPEFLDAGDSERGPFAKLWEAFVGFAAKLFENREADQVATQIPVSGEIENPDAGMLPAMVNLFRNAFVAAFAHALEGSIDLGDVTGGKNEKPADDGDTEGR